MASPRRLLALVALLTALAAAAVAPSAAACTTDCSVIELVSAGCAVKIGPAVPCTTVARLLTIGGKCYADYSMKGTCETGHVTTSTCPVACSSVRTGTIVTGTGGRVTTTTTTTTTTRRNVFSVNSPVGVLLVSGTPAAATTPAPTTTGVFTVSGTAFIPVNVAIGVAFAIPAVQVATPTPTPATATVVQSVGVGFFTVATPVGFINIRH